jgi:hypothetical protein
MSASRYKAIPLAGNLEGPWIVIDDTVLAADKSWIVATCTERPQAQLIASRLNLLLRYRQALEGLTPGGSEFFEDPERCAAYLRGKLGGMASALKRQAIESRSTQPKTEVPE